MDRDLETLAQLAGVYEAVAKPQQQQQELQQQDRQAKLAAALKLLSMGQEEDAAAADLEYKNRVLAATQKQQADELGFKAGSDLINMPGATLDSLTPALRDHPIYGPMFAAMDKAKLAKAVGALQPQVELAYQNSGHDLPTLRKALIALHGTQTDPRAFDNLDWSKLNSTLPANPTPTPAPVDLRPRSERFIGTPEERQIQRQKVSSAMDWFMTNMQGALPTN